jgi:hypothetical protein
MLPNLFVIGAAKAGTTALHHYLAQHPDIFMSPLKEPNYFAFDHRVRIFACPHLTPRNEFERDRLRRERYEISVLDRADYERLFARGRHRPIRGESSPAYLYFPGTAARIRRAVPDARIVAVLRNPVDRAYSKFLQMRRDSMEPLGDFAAAVAAEGWRKRAGWSPTWLYMDRGYYHRQLEPYFEQFDRSHIHVLLYDDLKRDPSASLCAIFEFLDVDSRVAPDTGERHNISSIAHVPRSRFLYSLLARPYLLSARLQGLLPEPIVRRGRPWARQLLLKRATPPRAAALVAELRQVLAGSFHDDVQRLEGLIQRDLSGWLGTRCEPAARATRAIRPRELVALQLRCG